MNRGKIRTSDQIRVWFSHFIREFFVATIDIAWCNIFFYSLPDTVAHLTWRQIHDPLSIDKYMYISRLLRDAACKIPRHRRSDLVKHVGKIVIFMSANCIRRQTPKNLHKEDSRPWRTCGRRGASTTICLISSNIISITHPQPSSLHVPHHVSSY